MSKVLLLSLTELKRAPYFKKYINLSQNEMDLLFLGDRQNDYYGIGNVWRVHNTSNKLISIIKYRKKLKTILKSRTHKLIIILHSQISVFCADILKTFKGGIILDIRDYIMEKNKIYSYIQNIIIQKSEATVISSPGYKEFLPKYKYLICHNTFEDENININKNINDLNTRPITIGQVGYIRFNDVNQKLIDIFDGDKNFIIKYVGKGSEELKHTSNNIKIVREFNSEDTIKMYKGFTFVNNYYGNDKLNLRYALSNKLYIAALLRIPLIVSERTFMEKYTKKYGIGISIDINNDSPLIIKEKIVEYLESVNYCEFDQACEKFLNEVNEENQLFYREIERIINRYENSAY